MKEKKEKQEQLLEASQSGKDVSADLQEDESITKEIEKLESKVKSEKVKIEKIDNILSAYSEKKENNERENEEKETAMETHAAEERMEAPKPGAEKHAQVSSVDGVKVVAKTAIGAGGGVLAGIGLIVMAAHAEVWVPIVLVKVAATVIGGAAGLTKGISDIERQH